MQLFGAELWFSPNRLSQSKSLAVNPMARQSISGRSSAVAVLVIAVVLLPLIAWGGYRAHLSNSNDVREWLPAEYPETQQYRRLVQHFSTHDFIIASWPGCTLDDQRLDDFV